MTAPRPHPLAEDWVAILSRPTLEAFAEAFVAIPTLEASVLAGPVSDVPGIRAFFVATRAMYDEIAFTADLRRRLDPADWRLMSRNRSANSEPTSSQKDRQ